MGRTSEGLVESFARVTPRVQRIAIALVLGALASFGTPEIAIGVPTRSSSSVLPAIPRGWPFAQFEIGMADDPGDATTLRSAAPFGFRYQYLAGGVNTGSGWTTWNPGGTFVSRYDAESFKAGMTPVYSYYMDLQSKPTGTDEATTDLAHLRDPALMRTYWAQVRLFFERARGPHTVVLQIEPDLWGYLEQAGALSLAHSFAATFVRLRNALAPNVLLAYHMSEWGTGHDIVVEKPSDTVVNAYAAQSAAFYRSLGVHFDVTFTDISDRDAGFYQYVDHNPQIWFASADFARMVLYDRTFVRLAKTRLVIWQIPLGNTVMRAENNTWDHYQDNRVQWFLGTAGRKHIKVLTAAGVIALLFGRGADGNTCACDAAGDGLTNPAPVDGNDRASLSADDDGGYFKSRVAAYYRAGAIALR